MAGKPRPLKIGIVCEGQPEGVEERVFPRLIKLICPCADHDIVPSGNRPKVLRDAPKIAQRLLAEGCSTVFVIWDTHPGWEDIGGTTDCKDHVKALKANLQAAGMISSPIVPIAICQMLEAWLLCDGDALGEAMRRGPRRPKIRHEANPDNVNNPKRVLRKAYQVKKVGTYNESVHAGHIAANLITTKRLRKSQSFARFEDKLQALCVSK